MGTSDEPDSNGPVSVVIPAHNEQAALAMNLPRLLGGCRRGELDVVVVANGCTDASADVARGFGPPVRVIETEEPGKIRALNLGDAAATGFPRFYLDADVEVTLETVRGVAEVLRSGEWVAASPALHVDTSSSSALVRSYYRFWSRLPKVADDLTGRGVYAVSEAGRRRFEHFPDVIADDQFVRRLFARDERISVPTQRSVVRAPRTAAALVGRRTRVLHGNRQLEGRQSFAGRLAEKCRDTAHVVRAEPSRAIDLVPFALIGVASRVSLARRRRRSPEPVGWGRDDSR